MLDWLIKDARIIDGTGSSPFRGDIAISGDRILDIGNLEIPTTKRSINGEGRFVCPGFIDMHSHSDILFLNGSSLGHKIYQGCDYRSDRSGWDVRCSSYQRLKRTPQRDDGASVGASGWGMASMGCKEIS